MPTLRFLAAALLLGACMGPAAPEGAPVVREATPEGEPIETPGFDTAAWITAVLAADGEAERVELSSRLLDAVDWRAACGEDDPTVAGRGDLALLPLNGGRALAEVTCERIAGQTAFALVDLPPAGAPRLVRAFGIDDRGVPTPDASASFFGRVLPVADAPGRFRIVTATAAHGGCGLDVRYRLDADGGAAIERVRAHPDCQSPLAPEAWPVTYPTD